MSSRIASIADLQIPSFRVFQKDTQKVFMYAATKAALQALREHPIVSIDIGSGAISITLYRLGDDGSVIPITNKIDIKRTGKTAREIANEMREALARKEFKDRDKFITGSEWLRNLTEGTEQDKALKSELDQIAKEEKEKGNSICMEVLSQLDETKNSSSYFQHLLPYLNKQNPYLTNVNSNNSAQCEVGNGSAQGMIMPTQKEPLAGKAVENMIANNQSVEEIVTRVSKTFLEDMIEAQGLKHLFLQGLLAVTLSKSEIMKGLGIEKEQENAWKTCQISFPVSKIIDILKQQKAQGTFTTTLAFLTAVQEKYGNIQIFNMKEPMPLFDAQGKALTFVDANGEEKPLLAKINSAGGHALKVITFLFTHIYNTVQREELGYINETSEQGLKV